MNDRISARVTQLVHDFEHYVNDYARNPAFDGPGQLQEHVETIRLRRELGSATAALGSEAFLRSLYQTLKAWRMTVRGARLISQDQFVDRLQEKASDIAGLDGIRIDDDSLVPHEVAQRLWQTSRALGIATSKAKLVAGSKTLHQVLPELVVPIDRMYTQKFFGWQNSQFQYGEQSCFETAFCAFAEIARKTNPQRYVSGGWNSSRTKVIDNAIVAMAREAKGQKRPAARATSRSTFTKTPTTTTWGKYRPLEQRLREVPKRIKGATLSFADLHRMGVPLPNSTTSHRASWANQTNTSGRPQANAWLSAGFRVESVKQTPSGFVRFKRT